MPTRLHPWLLALVAALGLARPALATEYYVDHIAVIPASPTDQDAIQLVVSGNLANTQSFVADISATVNGFMVNVTVDAGNGGGIFIPIMIPHSDTLLLGTLPAGAYAVQLSGTLMLDDAPEEEHSFIVSGGGGTTLPCDSLVIASVNWAPFVDTAVLVHVFNPTTELFDYPGFVLLDANGDTLAKETVNYFGIPQENWHLLSILPGATIPDGTFNGTLELWTGFYAEFACSWDMSLDLCPATVCDTLIIHVGNNEVDPASGSYTWTLQGSTGQSSSGVLTLAPGQQEDADTLCMPPGSYSLQVDPQAPPAGGAPFFGVDVPAGQAPGPAAPVSWSLPVPLSFTFYGPCIDPDLGVPAHVDASLTLARSGDVVRLSCTAGQLTGEIHVFDAMGRTVMHSKAGGYSLSWSTAGWARGLYVVRALGPDESPLAARFMVN